MKLTEAQLGFSGDAVTEANVDGADVEDGGGTPEVNNVTGVDGATAVCDAIFVAVAVAWFCVAITDAPSVVIFCWDAGEGVTEVVGPCVVIEPETGEKKPSRQNTAIDPHNMLTSTES